MLDNRLDEALALAQRRHEICGRLLSEAHPETARSLCDLGRTLCSRGSLEEGVAALRTAEFQQRTQVDSVEPDLGLTLVYLAEALQAEDRLHESMQAIDEALAIFRSTGDEQHPPGDERHPPTEGQRRAFVRALRQKARISQALGEYERAELQFRDALVASERTFGPNHVEFAESLMALGELLRLRARYSEAETTLREALRAMRELYGNDHAETAPCLAALGATLYDEGDLVEAEQSLRKAIAICRELPRSPTLTLSSSLNTLARIMVAKGDYQAARAFYEESTEVTRALRGSQSLEMATVLFHHAECVREETTAARSGVSYDVTAKGWNEAAELYQRSLEIRRQKLGPTHSLIAASMEGYAVIHQTLADDVPVSPLYEEALAMYRETLGELHPDTAKCRRNYGTHLRRTGRLQEAEDMLKEAVRVRRLIYHDHHISVADALYCLSNLYKVRDDWENVERTLAEALSIAEAQRPRVVGGLQERSRFSFSIRLHDYADGLARAQFHLRRFDDALTSFERGTSRLLLDLLLYPEHDQLVPLLRDPSQAILFVAAQRREADAAEQIAVREADLAGIRKRPDLSESEKRDEAQARMIDLRQSREKLRLAEAETMSFFTNAWPEAKPAAAEEIRAALRPDELLLDYRWNYLDVFLVVVPPCGIDSIQCIPLAQEGKQHRQLSELQRQALKAIIEREKGELVRAKVDELRDILLPPAAMKYVNRAKTLIVIPSGGVREIPLDVFFSPSVGADRDDAATDPTPAIIYSDSASLFVNYRMRPKLNAVDGQEANALVLGGPSFDERVVSLGDGLATRVATKDESRSSSPSKRDEVQFLGERLASLPGANAEAVAIGRAIRNAGGAVTMLQAEQASLGNLEANIGGKRFIHVATHGLMGKRDEPLDAALALAGALSRGEEGFLTLEHLFRTWSGKLHGCELVTLSACETNRGFAIGDSMMNLANGFLYAGAHSVVGSLWSVDEDAASLLMPRFYENLLGIYGDRRGGFPPGAKMPKAEALREAKMWLRRLGSRGNQATCERGGVASAPLKAATPKDFAQPYYWAPFILVGDPD